MLPPPVETWESRITVFMDGNRQYPFDRETALDKKQLSLAQLQQLVHLLDASDVSEVEVHRASEGLRLVLRKAKVQQLTETGAELTIVPPIAMQNGKSAVQEEQPETTRTVSAGLVGIFHAWARPKGKALVATGDRVKVGQLVGTIQSLNVINEVEAPVAGRVVEILVEDGQPVEYGQPLMKLDSVEEA